MTAMIPFPGEHDVTIVAFAGDWHGNLRYALKVLRRVAGRVDVVVHTGDFGFHDDLRFLAALNDEAERLGLIVMAVDGNHEQHPWLNEHPVDDDGVRRVMPRIWHLPRGFRWRWMGLDFLALGGAHSVDRQWRQEGVNWFHEEWITLAQAWKAAEGGPVDVMVTHDCPAGVDIPGVTDRPLAEAPFPLEELIKSDKHRIVLSEVVHAVTPRYLWHGHYHCRYDGTLPHENGQTTQVYGMDCDGAQIERNVMVVNLSDLQP